MSSIILPPEAGGLFVASTAYKPFRYSWAYEAYRMQDQIRWVPEEVPMGEDVRDWNENLTPSERHLVTQIFRFFTQGDKDISDGYTDYYLPFFKPHEIKMMLTKFADTESLHIRAYSLLLDTVGLPEVEYQAFLEYEQMAAKHEYLFKNDGPFANPTTWKEQLQKLALDIAVFSGAGEGVQLFSSFAILLNFTRHQKMKNMGRFIDWSIRDETLHVSSMIKLFHTLVDENPWLWTNQLKQAIYQAFRDMVHLEDLFIDLAFEAGEVQGITPEEIKQYVRYIADRRLLQMHLKPNFGVKVNPSPWIEELLNFDQFANFFETQVTEYSSGALQGDWNDINTLGLTNKNEVMRYLLNAERK